MGVNVDVQVGHFQAFPHPFVAGHEDGLQHDVAERVEIIVYLSLILQGDGDDDVGTHGLGHIHGQVVGHATVHQHHAIFSYW